MSETPRSARSAKKRKAPKKRNAPRKNPPPVPAADPDAPHWLVEDGRWIKMPENMRRMVARIINPAYRSLVLDARDELQRSIGSTLVHLMWLELSAQVDLGKTISDPQSIQAIMNNPEQMIERHLRLSAAKCQTAELLLKLRMVDGMLSHPSFSSGGNLPLLGSGNAPPQALHAPGAISPAPFSQTTGEDEIGKSKSC